MRESRYLRVEACFRDLLVHGSSNYNLGKIVVILSERYGILGVLS